MYLELDTKECAELKKVLQISDSRYIYFDYSDGIINILAYNNKLFKVFSVKCVSDTDEIRFRLSEEQFYFLLHPGVIDFEVREESIVGRYYKDLDFKNQNLYSYMIKAIRQEEISPTLRNINRLLTEGSKLKGSALNNVQEILSIHKFIRSSEGVIIKDGYTYVDGNGFKVFKKLVNDGLNMAFSTDTLRELKKFIGVLDYVILKEVDNYVLVYQGESVLGFKKLVIRDSYTIDRFVSRDQGIEKHGDAFIDYSNILNLLYMMRESSVDEHRCIFNFSESKFIVLGRGEEYVANMLTTNKELDEVELDFGLLKTSLTSMMSRPKITHKKEEDEEQESKGSIEKGFHGAEYVYHTVIYEHFVELFRDGLYLLITRNV